MNIEHSIDNCTGCQACISICPSKCITMQADEEGFLYPKVAHARCVDCSLCVKRCPQESTNHLEGILARPSTMLFLFVTSMLKK